MRSMNATLFRLITILILSSDVMSNAGTFGADADFLKQHTDLVVLSDPGGRAKVAVAPAWQGRVMTSTAGGDSGRSFGWINRELIASRQLQKHINVFGGEDRMWLGPEGGQFSIFFAKGAKFELADWYTPAAIDTMAWPITAMPLDYVSWVTVGASFTLTNFSGSQFHIKAERTVRLLSAETAWEKLGTKPMTKVELVAYESDNRITNAGSQPWKKETGLLSIWMLGMFNPSPGTTIVVPIKAGSEKELGVKVTSDYFGAIPADRLKVTDEVIYFSGDGKFRSKIGINPRRSKAVLGSYDSANHVLTIVQFTQPAGAVDYVNSLWKIQEHPFIGDAANSYNDGPPAPGAKPLGPFYELESSSPAAALEPGKSLSHIHRTVHLSGPEAELDAVAKQVLGVSLKEITSALK
jgi:hypothetical protein